MKTPTPIPAAPEWAWRVVSLCALPALLWSFSLSRERAEVQFRLEALERVTTEQRSRTQSAADGVQELRSEMREMRVVLGYLRRDIADLKTMISTVASPSGQ